MPNNVLWDIIPYMKKLGGNVNSPYARGCYLSRVDILSERIARYCLENGDFSEKMSDYLEKQGVEKLLRFLKSIYVLQFSEETWCYWLCYSTLNYESQRNAKAILSGCTGLLPHYDKLFSLYFYNRDSNIAFQHLILTAEEKYHTDKERLMKALINTALSHFKQYSDKAALVRRVWDIMSFDISLDPADWSVLLTYEHLCDMREISRAGEYVLSTMSDGKNLQRDCTLELAKYFARRFREQIEEREGIELEQFLSFDEEIE